MSCFLGTGLQAAERSLGAETSYLQPPPHDHIVQQQSATYKPEVRVGWIPLSARDADLPIRMLHEIIRRQLRPGRP